VIRDIVYALSHDLRTPLAAAELTQRQALLGAYGELPEAYRDILRRSIEANADLQRLAETLLMVARYESGEASRTREPVDVAAAARKVAEDLVALAALRKIELTVSGDERGSVAGDESEIRRAIMNLASNALTFTPEGGHVQIKVTHDGGRLRVTVADDGYGVPEDAQARLFERFAGESSRRGAGTGLGLYIVRRIAEAHGGVAWYAPKPGGGSTFMLEFPALAVAGAPDAA
jgi:signal transduction histidine kinase